MPVKYTQKRKTGNRIESDRRQHERELIERKGKRRDERKGNADERSKLKRSLVRKEQVLTLVLASSKRKVL